MTKLADANNAGGRHSERCTLILTEGDSAKALAVAGLGVVGRDNFGVFPLRGKLLNVRDAKHEQIMKNEEIQAIKKIMGLQHSKKYDSVSGLRYGRLMIMTDQVGTTRLLVKACTDGPAGSRWLPYQGLDHQFPGLLLSFVVECSRVLVRIRYADCQGVWFVRFSDARGYANRHGRSRRANNEKTSLQSLSTNNGWRKPLMHGNGNPSTTRSVYSSANRVTIIMGPQGLGTSKDSDARDYFSNMKKHTIAFSTTQEGDKQLIELAFSKSKADDRKEWLRQFKVFRLRYCNNSVAH